jgi:nucleotide-binding universal stress UspA family protein
VYERILVPLDGSADAEVALPMALSLASRLHAELILLRVNEPIPNLPAGRYPESVEASARDYLARTAEPIVLRRLTVRTMVEYGDPAEVIPRLASELGTDLVVLAAGDGFRHRIPRGDAARILRRCVVPLLVVPSAAATARSRT